jgi:alkanesulfonate monooxygenase SsuD/methylene tetrahydromethanopterin reductase-like flavin-dependent oxidoreductase (luciferase family)
VRIGLLSLGDHLADPNTGVRVQSQADRHRSIVESACVAEAVGFDSFWLGEHHFCDYITSSPPVVLAAIASRTSRLRLGTGVTLLANLDPLRVAEDYATLDCLSAGRAEMVVGRGILADAYEAFGQPPDESRAIYREKLELLLRLWREEDVRWAGRWRGPLSGVTAQPRPVQAPHPPVWIGGGSSVTSADLAAELGLPLMLPSVLAPPALFAPLVERYREKWEAFGHDPLGLRVGACNHLHVRRSSQDARSFWEPYYRNYLQFVDRVWVNRELIHPAARVDFDYARLLRGAAICGSPAEVVARMQETRELLGLDLHLVMLDLGGLPEAELFRTLELFGSEVLPALR